MYDCFWWPQAFSIFASTTKQAQKQKFVVSMVLLPAMWIVDGIAMDLAFGIWYLVFGIGLAVVGASIAIGKGTVDVDVNLEVWTTVSQQTRCCKCLPWVEPIRS